MKGNKLYEHIRLGAMLGPQLYGKTQDDDGGSCSLGAAGLSMGVEMRGMAFGVVPLAAHFPFIASDLKVKVPSRDGGAGRPMRVPYAIAELNDIFLWTREAIAAWLEPIEEAWWKEQEARDMDAVEEVTSIAALVGAVK